MLSTYLIQYTVNSRSDSNLIFTPSAEVDEALTVNTVKSDT